MLIEKIKTPAMLEQTAEEAIELAFACLKLARMLRGENKVHGRIEEDLVDNIEEEFADIRVCYEELFDGGVINQDNIEEWMAYKRDRMLERIETDYKEICHGCVHVLDPMEAEPCLKCYRGDRYVGRKKMEKIKLGELLQYIRDDDITVIIVKNQWDKIQGEFPSDSPLLDPFIDKEIDELEICAARLIKISFV